jgi:predicted ArsR family transcriptional regulator
LNKKKADAGRIDLVDPVLLSATCHPVRAYCLSALFERQASPREFAEELDLPVQNVSYHIRELEKLGCIELVRTEKGRSTEHFYRAIRRHLVEAADWAKLDSAEQAKVTTSLLRLISDDVGKALAHGTIDDDDNHISRVPMTVDQMGWGEVVDLLKETVDRLLGIGVTSAQRTVDGESDPDDVIPIKVEIIHFRSPTRA